MRGRVVRRPVLRHLLGEVRAHLLDVGDLAHEARGDEVDVVLRAGRKERRRARVKRIPRLRADGGRARDARRLGGGMRACTPKAMSVLSLSLIAGSSTFAPGRLTPLRSPISDVLSTFARAEQTKGGGGERRRGGRSPLQPRDAARERARADRSPGRAHATQGSRAAEQRGSRAAGRQSSGASAPRTAPSRRAWSP